MTTDAIPHNAEPMNAPRELTLAAVQEMVAECLFLEATEVSPQAKFFDDLAGESIDLLELSFHFEKAFHIRAPYKAFDNKDLWERDESGQFTPAAQELMRRDFAYLGLEQRFAAAGSSNPRSLLTIELMYVMLKHADGK